ncbi:hypothetical protein OY671_011342, partial [Metschnikowia pulcherrima]
MPRSKRANMAVHQRSTQRWPLGAGRDQPEGQTGRDRPPEGSAQPCADRLRRPRGHCQLLHSCGEGFGRRIAQLRRAQQAAQTVQPVELATAGRAKAQMVFQPDNPDGIEFPIQHGVQRKDTVRASG